MMATPPALSYSMCMALYTSVYYYCTSPEMCGVDDEDLKSDNSELLLVRASAIHPPVPSLQFSRLTDDVSPPRNPQA